MNHGPLIFLGVFLCIMGSWVGTIVFPQLQFGGQEPVVIVETDQLYPPARSGEARQGAEVFRANGCNYCHTQLVRPTSEGGDIARGWGKRRTVARDYLRDQPLMLGQVRFGPDLANLGARETNTHTLFLKLYNARTLLPTSTMPRYAYLFEQRPLRPGHPSSPDALSLPSAFAPPAGYEIVPTPAARELVAYLGSLKSEEVFYEVFPPLPPKRATNLVSSGDTNTPAAGTNATPAASPVATNPPAAQ